MKKIDKLMALNRAALYDLAIECDITGRSAMSKKDLAKKLSDVRGITSKLSPELKQAKKMAENVSSLSPREELVEGIAKKFEITREETHYPQVKTKPSKHDAHGLPESYNIDKIALMVKDPYWLFTYWETSSKLINRLIRKIGERDFKNGSYNLRVYDVTDIMFNGKNAHHYRDVSTGDVARSWYIKVSSPDRSYCVDLGFKLKSGLFIFLARSNTVHTPRASISDLTDEKYRTILDKYEEIFSRSGGYEFGTASEAVVKKNPLKELDEDFFGSSLMGSEALVSGALQNHAKKKSDLWLNLKTELVLYGSTDPDAHLFVGDNRVILRKDGTFTLRYVLPDGELKLPVKSVSKNNDRSITITSAINKKTR